MLFFSKNEASVAAVIPAMDRITSSLNNIEKRAYHPAIMATMKLASKKMDCYYSLTDTSATYRIAMILHPGMKLEYFRQQEWQEDWIETAEKLLCDEYTSRYEKQPETTDKPKTPDVDFTSFGDLSVKQPAGHANELDEYLRQPVESVREPLKWWTHKRALYPNLSRMALDYLSIPGMYIPQHQWCTLTTLSTATSTAVERVFFQGRHLLSHTRNRLSGSSIRAHLCLGSWARNDLTQMSDLIAAVKGDDKKKRKRTEAEPSVDVVNVDE